MKQTNVLTDKKKEEEVEILKFSRTDYRPLS